MTETQPKNAIVSIVRQSLEVQLEPLRADALANAGAALHPSAVVPLCSQKVGPCPIPTIRSRIRRPMAGCASNNSEELLRLAEAELPETELLTLASKHRESAECRLISSAPCACDAGMWRLSVQCALVGQNATYQHLGVVNPGFDCPLSKPGSIDGCTKPVKGTILAKNPPGIRRISGNTFGDLPCRKSKWQTTCIGLKNTPE